MVGIEEILALEHLEKDIFRGAVHPTALQRTFGGQVAGQSLVSAVSTVDESYHVHSLHGYFLRPGNPKIPTVYLVDRIRDGRSFCTRRVNAVQDGKTIFTMSASFHVDDEGIEHQDRMPSVPAPEDLPDAQTVPKLAESQFYQEWKNWDIRIVPAEQSASAPDLAAQQRVWMRYREALPDRPLLHICTLAYLSDMTLLGTSKVPHRGVKTRDSFARSRDVVPASVPGRRVVALRPDVAVGRFWSRAHSGAYLRSRWQHGGSGGSGGFDASRTRTRQP